MTLTLPPDGEHIVGDYLRDHADVDALNTQIVGITPKDTGASWVRLTQLDASNQTGAHVEHLVAFLFQLDCYSSSAGVDGSPQKQARLIARTIRAALMDMPGQTVDGVKIASCRITGDIRRPDTDLEPARERVILTAQIGMHA